MTVRRLTFVFAACFVTCLLSAGPAPAQPGGASVAMALEQALLDVVEKREPSVVSIARIRRTRPLPAADRFGPFGPDPRREGRVPDANDPSNPDFVPNDFGTGVLLRVNGKPERYVLTNYHVVRGGPPLGKSKEEHDYRLFVRLFDRRGYYAEIVAADPRSDLAVLSVDLRKLDLDSWDDVPAIHLEQPARFRKGQFVLAMGNPYAIARDGSASVSWGTISNVARRPAPSGSPLDPDARKKETIHHFGTLLQVDTRLELGTSGGPLFDLRGNLIGLTTSLAALEGYERSSGFAVPFDDATLEAIRTLVEGKEVEYGFLGIQPLNVLPGDNRLPERFDRITAARAESVIPNSPAHQAGLLPGDVILAVDDVPVHDRYDLMREVGQAGAGEVVDVTVWRDTTRRRLTLKPRLGKWPVQDDEGIITTARHFPEWRGLTVDFPTARWKHLQWPYRYHEAVLVTDVSPVAAARLGKQQLQEGDFVTHVDGRPVATPQEFAAATRNLTGEVTLQLLGGTNVTIKP